MFEHVSIIGAGLAGSECALQLAKRKVPATLFEMRPLLSTGAHHSAHAAELVCSNSFKSKNEETAAGLLKWELAQLDSELLKIAKTVCVEAGQALAVDREAFSAAVDEALNAAGIEVVREEVVSFPKGFTVLAAGPLCSQALSNQLEQTVGEDSLSFFDAAAPIIDADSIDVDCCFAQSRYEKGGDDYLNCPLTKSQYEQLVEELCKGSQVILRDFEGRDLFQACQPVEEVAKTGMQALSFGALKPKGLIDPKTGEEPYAAVQLRAENAYRTAYNMVGFQTNLTFAEQKRIFGIIPALRKAEYLRYGVMHKNTFVNAPRVCDRQLRLLEKPTIFLAGQILGTEGYAEAIAGGLHAAEQLMRAMAKRPPARLPETTALGSLLAYATDPSVKNYQPMHVNFGLVPSLSKRYKKRERYAQYAARAKKDLIAYLQEDPWGRA